MGFAREFEGSTRMNGPDEDRYVGQRVRMIRARRGISQQVLADLAGLSRSAIAKYETGERPVDSRRTLLALAKALGVTLGDLTGQVEERFDPSVAGIHGSVLAIETALWAAGNITPTAPKRTLDQLASAAREIAALKLECNYAELGPKIAPVLTECYQHARDTRGADRDRAWDILAATAHTAAAVLKNFGYQSLAWTAAQEAEKAAHNGGGTAAHAAAAFIRSQIMLSRPDGLPAALESATSAGAALGGLAHTAGEMELCGMLQLQVGLVTAAMGNDPTPHFDEATEQTVRRTYAAPNTSLLSDPTFVKANVVLWRMSAAMERRDAEQVLTLAPQLRPTDLPSEGRRAQYFVEIGRAQAMRRNYRGSLHALLHAEHAAPQKVRNMTHVRELAGQMMRSARRDLTAGELGRLAQRVGVVSA
ncbi:helix-turn-helix transcriptional regulator [Nocardia sp. NPDC024068]|uniref:helix-turn-helix domain-containing protein n=1 Tax=Nocardia sp. NPDC024068 TaxID=3157197 RepID=UPI0033ED0BAF